MSKGQNNYTLNHLVERVKIYNEENFDYEFIDVPIRRVMDKTEFLAAIKDHRRTSMVTSVHDENGDYLIVETLEVEEVTS